MRFVVVYQREPHARQMAFDDIPQPKTYAERVALAQATLEEYNLDLDVWIDDLGDVSRAAFGDLPNAAIVIDPLGKIRLKLSWMDPAVLALTLPEIQRLPKDLPPPAERRFLTAVDREPAPTDGVSVDGARRHHRHAMLAQLALRHPEHAERDAWLRELADGPEQQRAWVTRQLASQDPAARGGTR